MIMVVLIMLLIAFLQVPVLLRQKQWKELLSFSALWIIAAVYSLLVTLNVPLPTVLEVIDIVYGGISQLAGLLSL